MNSPKFSTSTPPSHPTRLCVALLMAASSGAFAQGSAPAAPAAPAAAQLTPVVVTGQQGSLRRSLAAQASNDGIVSVLSSDDIGALPDKNAAEALARLPGVSVQRDQGEGRYVVIRGLGPDLNTVTINGALAPAAEAGRRGVALDVLPAGLIRSITVQKTLRPDQDANSLGGTVDVQTLSAFDLPGRLVSLNAGATRDGLTGQTSPNLGGLFASRFLDGRAGIALGFSAEERRFGSDNVETGGAWNNGRVGGFELRDYLPNRERQALSMNVDLRPQPGTEIYLRLLTSQFSDDEVRDRLTISNISLTNPTPPPATLSTAVPGDTFTSRVERRLRQRKYTQNLRSVTFGGEHTEGDWTLKFAGGLSKASEDTPESINDARFRGASNFAGLRFTNPEIPTLAGPATLFDPARYNLNAITLQQRISRDEEAHFKGDLGRRIELAGLDTRWQAGAKNSRRTKTNDTNQWGYSSSNPTSPSFWGAGPTTLAGFAGAPVDFGLGTIGPSIDPAAVRARIAPLPRDGARLLEASTVNDYTMRENIDAAYAMSTVESGALSVTGGLRYERTEFSANGSQLQGTTVTPRTAGSVYSDWLPSLQARYDLGGATSVRAAVTRSVVRASFAQLAPGVTLASPTEATVGNPELLPLRSTNFDLGVERSFGDGSGAASAYLFRKDIRNFTYGTNLAGTAPWQSFTTVNGFANGDDAKADGIELSYQQALRGLPVPFNGLIVGVNASWIQARGNIARFDAATQGQRSREIPLPGASDRVLNLVLGYEAGPVSTRIAANHKSPYLLQTGSDILNASQDLYVDTQTQVDFSFAWRLSRQWAVGFEVANLTNEKYFVYQGSKPFNAQYEQYGRSYKITLKADFQ